MKAIQFVIRTALAVAAGAVLPYIASRVTGRSRSGGAGITAGQGYRRGVTTAFDHDRGEPWRYDDGNPTPLESVDEGVTTAPR